MNIAPTIRRIATPVALAALLACVAPVHAQTDEDKASVARISQEADDLMSALKAYGAAQRDEALKKAEATLDSLDRRIDALESRVDAQWNKMDAAAQMQARESLRALQRERREVARWFGSMRDGSVEAWDKLKAGFVGAYESLDKAWQKAEKDVTAKKTK